MPNKTHHGWRFLAFGPDGLRFVVIGAACNGCRLDRFSAGDHTLEYRSMTRMDQDDGHWEQIARGVRNSVGFGWDPKSQTLWFTDKGRDLLGDHIPSDELNVLDPIGQDFGFPFFHAGTIANPKLSALGRCGDSKAPALLPGPHVAPLGRAFNTGAMFPKSDQGDVFIVEHHSWNKTKKIGDRVMNVIMRDGKAVGQDPFVQG